MNYAVILSGGAGKGEIFLYREGEVSQDVEKEDSHGDRRLS